MKEVKISKVNDTRCKAHVTFDAESTQSVQKNALNKIRAKAKIPGFRQGKAPDALIKQKYPGDVYRETINSAVMDSLTDIAEESENGFYSIVQVVKVDFEGQSGVLDLEFDLPPIVKIKKIKDIVIKENIPEIREADIDKEIDEYRRRDAKFETTEEAPKDGDNVIVDYELWINDAPYGEEVKDRPVRIGSRFFDEALEAELLSRPAKKGEEFSHVTMRKNQDGGEDKYETFITVKEVQKAILPEVTDEFAQKQDPEFTTVAIMREKIKQNLEKRFQRRNLAFEADSAFQKLLPQAEYFFSESFLEDEEKSSLQGLGLEQLPEEKAPELRELVIQKAKGQYLSRHLHQLALKESGKTLSEELSSFVEAEIGKEAAEIAVRLLQIAQEQEEKLDGYSRQILDSYLHMLTVELHMRFFRKEGLVKKGKKLSFEELEQQIKSANEQKQK